MLVLKFCEALNKNIEIEVDVQIKKGRGEIVKTIYKCNGGMFELGDVKAYGPCKMRNDKRCLLGTMNT